MPKYEAITTFEQVLWLKEQLDTNPAWSFDTEGTSLDVFENKIIGIGFSWERGTGHYLILRQYRPIIGLQDYWKEKQQDVLNILEAVLANDATKAAHNAKYDVQAIYADLGFTVNNLTIDTMLLLSVVDSKREHYSLDSLSAEFPDLAGYKQAVDKKQLMRVPLAEIVEYNGKDVDLTFRLVEDHVGEMDDKMQFLFSEMVMPLMDMLARMEMAGIRVDTEYAKKFHDELFAELAQLHKEITDAIGFKFSIRSGDQLIHALFDVLKLPVLKKTKGGKPKTGKNELLDLEKKTKNPVLKKIIKYKSLAANKTGFVDACVKPIARKDNKDKDYILDKNNYLHGNYKQISKTGRLRSGRDEDAEEGGNSRNLQNTPRDPRFRRMFLPDPDHVFIGADYAQLELRVLAHVCGDKELLTAFREDYDPHCLVGANMSGLSYEEVLDGYKKKIQKYIDIRNLSKNIGFGWVYMAGDGRFAYLFPGDNDKQKLAAEIAAKERYFSRFSRIVPWRESSLAFAREHGFVRTLSGRKIYTLEINSKIDRVRAHAEKQCVNSLIQGPASDMTCLSGIETERWVFQNEINARPLNLIHDAIYFSAHKDAASSVYWALKDIMETPKFGITTKMKADIHAWDRWEGTEVKIDTMESLADMVDAKEEVLDSVLEDDAPDIEEEVEA